MGPLLNLQKTMRDLDVLSLPKCDWEYAMKCDVAFLQRPFTAEHSTAAMIFAKNGIPIWVDFDDLLFDVPSWNPAFKHFHNDACQRALREVCNYASVITVTNDDLRAQVAKLTGKNPIVIPNALQDRWPLRGPNPEQLIYWWRGGLQHRIDHQTTRQMFLAVAEASPEAKFWFIGDDPYYTEELGTGRVEVIRDPLDIVFFHEVLLSKNPSVLLYGLQDCDFNRCKSSCSWLEATMCGSIVVGPDFPEFVKPGIVNYRAGDMESAREAAVSTLAGVDRQKAWQASARHLQENYRLSGVNKERERILRQLVKR